MVTHTQRQRYRYVGVGTYRPQDAANLADRALLGLTTPRGQWEPQTEPQTEPTRLHGPVFGGHRREAVSS